MPDRIEREIEDILRKVEDIGEHRKKRSNPPRKPPSRPSLPTARSLGPQMRSWVILAAIIAVAVFLERSSYASGLVLTLVIVGLIALGAYLLREVGAQSKPRNEMRWRGQTLDLNQPAQRKGIPFLSWFRRRP